MHSNGWRGRPIGTGGAYGRQFSRVMSSASRRGGVLDDQTSSFSCGARFVEVRRAIARMNSVQPGRELTSMPPPWARDAAGDNRPRPVKFLRRGW